MIEFIQNNPEYLLVLGASALLVCKIMKIVLSVDQNEDDDQDDDGGIPNPDPVLDLPPGVALPAPSSKEKASGILA